MSVRFAPSERSELDAKAAIAGVTPSEGVRAAVRAWRPSAPEAAPDSAAPGEEFRTT